MGERRVKKGRGRPPTYDKYAMQGKRRRVRPNTIWVDNIRED